MGTIFRDKFRDVPDYKAPNEVSDEVLTHLLIHIQTIKDRQIAGDQILQKQWFMADIQLNTGKIVDEWREETIFDSTQTLLKIATTDFKINNDATMIQFFKVLFRGPPA